MFSEIASRLAGAQTTGRVPTIVAGIVRDGTLLWTGSAGAPVVPGTQFRIGSITKTLTAMIVMAERDTGRLRLDDRLDAYLPGCPVGAVTIRQVLGHASGLRREPVGEWWERSAGTSIPDLLAGLTADQLAHPPHRVYHYSNLGYGLLGALLREVTGSGWYPLVDERILQPLGLHRTAYHPTEPFARGYVVHPWDQTLREEPRHDAGAMAPAGQLWSTVDDLARYAAFLADPDPRILAPATLDEMCVPVSMSENWTGGHGLGIEMYRRGERVYIGHGGSMPGYLASLAVHRPTRTGVVAYANAYTLRGGSLSAVALDLLDTVVDAMPPAPKPWRPRTGTAHEDLCGRWWWMGREYEIAADPGALTMTPLTVPGAAPWRFVPDGPDRWLGTAGMNAGEPLTVHRGPDGAPATLDIATFLFTRRP